MFTETLKERNSIAGTPLHSDDRGAGIYNTGTVDMSKFNRVQFTIDVGTVGVGGTLDAALQQGDQAGGGDAAAFSPAVAIAQITASDKTKTLEVRADQMTKRYVRCQAVVAVNTIDFSVMPLATDARHKPQSSDDASVTERVVA